jgi:hypothetical protein
MPRNPDDIIIKQDILLSVSRGGEVVLNVGEAVDGVGVGAEIGMWGVAGFISMPDPPDPGASAAQALILVDGQTKRVIATRDNRHNAKVGELKPGDRAIVSSSRGRVLVKKDTHSVTCFTESEDGTSMMFNLDGSTGKGLIAIGSAYIEIKDGELILNGGGTMLKLSSKGCEIIGKHFAANCRTGNLGMVGVVQPPTGLCSIIGGVSGITGTPAAGWTVSPS